MKLIHRQSLRLTGASAAVPTYPQSQVKRGIGLSQVLGGAMALCIASPLPDVSAAAVFLAAATFTAHAQDTEVRVPPRKTRVTRDLRPHHRKRAPHRGEARRGALAAAAPRVVPKRPPALGLDFERDLNRNLAGLFGRGTSGEGCDVTDLRLPGVQEDLLRVLVGTGTPVVLVMVTGRPYAIGPLADRLAASVQAFFGGEEGGGAIAGVLSGRIVPSGRLPVEMPSSPGANLRS